MAGSISEPIAITVAGLEPDKVAKKAQATMEAMARPPGIQPTSVTAKLMMRLATPPSVRKVPASTKNGTAMIAKLSRPVNRRCEMMFTVVISNDEKNTRKVITVMPSAMEIGVPVISSRARMPIIIAAVISLSPCRRPDQARPRAVRQPDRPRWSGRCAGNAAATG